MKSEQKMPGTELTRALDNLLAIKPQPLLRSSAWTPVPEEGPNGVDESQAPFDGKQYLIKRTGTDGEGEPWVDIVSAWWHKSEKIETYEGTEYEGYYFVAYDDTFQIELAEGLLYMEIPE